MPIPGRLLTTAMAVMPHIDVERALALALSLDVPYWPQLPNYNYYEDMYVQASEHFPGILLDLEKRTLRFSMDQFAAELEEALLDDLQRLQVEVLGSRCLGGARAAGLGAGARGLGTPGVPARRGIVGAAA